MNKKSVAFELVVGSANINSMRNTIKQVVSMVCSLVDTQPKERIYFELSHSNNCWWFIVQEPSGSIYPKCKYSTGRQSEGNFDRIPAQYIEGVYDSLPTFVEMMVVTFPSLKEKFEPYLAASRRAL